MACLVVGGKSEFWICAGCSSYVSSRSPMSLLYQKWPLRASRDQLLSGRALGNGDREIDQGRFSGKGQILGPFEINLKIGRRSFGKTFCGSNMHTMSMTWAITCRLLNFLKILPGQKQTHWPKLVKYHIWATHTNFYGCKMKFCTYFIFNTFLCEWYFWRNLHFHVQCSEPP